MKITEIVEFNPPTRLSTGSEYPFIEMAVLPIFKRDMPMYEYRAAGGSGSKFRNGDTILPRITPCLENGKGGLVRNLPSDGLGHGSTEFIVMRSHKRSDEQFVYYLSRLPEFRAFAIQQMTGTSGRQRVSWQSLTDFEVVDLNFELRENIGASLGMLDDKIELNRRMNETLEAMARAIFKDWFVDFGPICAKAEGREPYLAPDLWNLFPDALDDEDKPVGWESKPLDEVADFLNGLALQKFPAFDPEESLPVIKIAELRSGITAKSNRASHEVPDKYVVRDGDFLFSWSGSLLAKFWTEGDGALNQHLFKVTSDRYPVWFFSEWVHHHLKEFQMIAASKATTMGHIQRGHLKDAMTTCPPDGVLSALGKTASPLVERTIKNDLESHTLAQTRDLLLPKLLSGEIRLAEVEEAVEAVA